MTQVPAKGCARGDLSVGDVVDNQVADEDVIDQLAVAAVDAGVSVVGGLDARVEVPQPRPVPLIRLVVAAGSDLGTGGSGQDLGRGGLRSVVEVTAGLVPPGAWSRVSRTVTASAARR